MTSRDSSAPALPPAVKRLARWFWLPVIVAALGLSSLLFWEVPRVVASLKGWGVIVIPNVFFVPQFIAILGVWLGNRRIKARYLAARGRLCTNCTYSLLGLPDSGQCPECATRYDFPIDACAWNRAKMPAVAGERCEIVPPVATPRDSSRPAPQQGVSNATTNAS